MFNSYCPSLDQTGMTQGGSVTSCCILINKFQFWPHYEPRGQEFESLRARQSDTNLGTPTGAPIFISTVAFPCHKPRKSKAPSGKSSQSHGHTDPAPAGRTESLFSCPLFRNPEEHGQATLDLHQGIRVDAAESRTQFVALHRHGLVHHHLRWPLQTVFCAGL